MDIFKNRITEVTHHIIQNDLSLAYRRLIDLILDLGETSFYEKIIHYSDLFYDETIDRESKKDAALKILEALNQTTSPVYKEEEILITITNIAKSYSNRNFKLHPVTFDLRSREVVGLVGENGNGKTTLLRLIAGELKPTAGIINYQFSAASHFTFDLKSQLVFVPQRIEELYGSLINNLQFTLSCYNYKGRENFLLAQVMLARLGLWQYKDLEWRQLSSGYKMRFEIARTLLRKPKVLLLDEPLANLDIMAQQIILEDLKYLSQSVSYPFGVILSSQQLYEVEKVSTEILFLEQGKLKYQSDNGDLAIDYTIIEIDVANNKQELLTTLNTLDIIDLKFNGGAYIAYFSGNVKMNDILSLVGKSDLEVKYIRNISESSRRYFVN